MLPAGSTVVLNSSSLPTPLKTGKWPAARSSFRCFCFAGSAMHSLIVADWMTRHPETIEPDQPAEHAAVLMIHGGFRHLPVVSEGKVVGILSIRDLMRGVLDDAAPRGV